MLSLVGLGLRVSIVPEMAARHDSDPSREYCSLRARPEREIAIVRRSNRSGSALCRRFLELVQDELTAPASR